MRFRRFKTESKQFSKMQKQYKNLSSCEKKRIAKALQREAAFIEGKSVAGGTLEHEFDIIALQSMLKSPRACENMLPMRDTKSFV